jgi:tetratricopeptide (TPR) repeat protein
MRFDATHSTRNRRTGRRPARAATVAALAAGATLLSGCAMSVLGKRVALFEPGEEPAAARPGSIAEAREQMALAPSEPYWPYRMGQLYLTADSAARAESALETALARDPSYAPALSLLSKMYYDTGRHEDAVRMIEAARSRAAASGVAGGVPRTLLVGLALHYDALGRPDLADPVMAEAAQPSRAGSADVYMTLRGATPEAATEMATEAVQRDPRNAVHQNNYGIVRLRAGDAKAARRAFEAALELDPKLPGPYYNLAILEKYYLLDDEAAARWFKQYWQRSTADPDGLAAVFGKSAEPLAGTRE